VTEPTPTVHDLADLITANEERTAALRAEHPLNRPALDPSERDSEVRVVMGFAGAAAIAMAAAVLLAIGMGLAFVYGVLRPIAPAAARAIDAWLQSLSGEQVTAGACMFGFLSNALLCVLVAGLQRRRRATCPNA
jgi:hypothetical protein